MCGRAASRNTRTEFPVRASPKGKCTTTDRRPTAPDSQTPPARPSSDVSVAGAVTISPGALVQVPLTGSGSAAPSTRIEDAARGDAPEPARAVRQRGEVHAGEEREREHRDRRESRRHSGGIEPRDVFPQQSIERRKSNRMRIELNLRARARARTTPRAPCRPNTTPADDLSPACGQLRGSPITTTVTPGKRNPSALASAWRSPHTFSSGLAVSHAVRSAENPMISVTARRVPRVRSR